MWDVTIVAIGPFPVRTVRPGGILRCHYMTVYARGRVIGKVRSSFRDIDKVKEESKKNAQYDDHRDIPVFGGCQLVQKNGNLHMKQIYSKIHSIF